MKAFKKARIQTNSKNKIKLLIRKITRQHKDEKVHLIKYLNCRFFTRKLSISFGSQLNTFSAKIVKHEIEEIRFDQRFFATRLSQLIRKTS